MSRLGALVALATCFWLALALAHGLDAPWAADARAREEPWGQDAPPDAEPSPETAEPTLPESPRLIDAHNHWPVGLPVSALVSILDQAGISRVVLMQNGLNHQPALPIAREYPDRILPFLGMVNGPRARAALEDVDRQLSSGAYFGIGELLVLHYGFDAATGRGNEAPHIQIPADSSWVLDLLCLAGKHNVVLTIHMESTPENDAALQRALSLYPNTKVIWAHQTPLKTYGGQTAEHARRGDPEHLGSLLAAFPNLFADVALGYENFFFDAATDLTLPDAWRSLYERHSDRFVVGLDMPFLSMWDPEPAVRRARRAQVWIEQLTPLTRARFAHENIERILAARPASGQTCSYRTP